MPVRATIDSNVLVYAELEPESDHGLRAAHTIQAAAARGVLAVQALLEFVAVVRRRRPESLASAFAKTEAVETEVAKSEAHENDTAKSDTAEAAATFTYALDRKKLRQVRRRQDQVICAAISCAPISPIAIPPIRGSSPSSSPKSKQPSRT